MLLIHLYYSLKFILKTMNYHLFGRKQNPWIECLWVYPLSKVCIQSDFSRYTQTLCISCLHYSHEYIFWKTQNIAQVLFLDNHHPYKCIRSDKLDFEKTSSVPFCLAFLQCFAIIRKILGRKNYSINCNNWILLSLL